MPVYQINDLNQAKAQSFTCLTWVRAALEELRKYGVVATLGEEEIQKKAMKYVERKRGEGKWKGKIGVPMLDLGNGREVVG